MTTRVFFLFLVTTLGLFNTSAMPTIDSPQDFFERGMTLLEEGEYIKAISQFSSAISMDKNFGKAYYQRAIAKQELSKAKDFEIPDLVVDLILAYRNGYQEALPILESHGNRKCLGIKQALILPDQSFCLDMSSSSLSTLPPSYDELMFLVYIKLYNNKFSTFPKPLLENEFLVSIDLSSNFLTTIPQEIANISWLVEINLSRNQITTLPNDFTKLHKLKRVNLSKNQLKALPEAIGDLTELEEIDFSFNQIQTIPPSIKKLTQLKRVILVGNPIPKSEIKDLKKVLKDTEIFAE